jgi:hypothetical protein
MCMSMAIITAVRADKWYSSLSEAPCPTRVRRSDHLCRHLTPPTESLLFSKQCTARHPTLYRALTSGSSSGPHLPCRQDQHRVNRVRSRLNADGPDRELVGVLGWQIAGGGKEADTGPMSCALRDDR